ncbi:MAG: hypothetical protein Q8P05_03610 [Candidatus Diapherotrites archaeon]|nr:hypothetical protein [Candidatus Diapherotrites archaeon]MDZ4256491.1 hypothetical protein [archaeon]
MDKRAVAMVVGLILISLGILFWVTQWELPIAPDASMDAPEWVLLQPGKCTVLPWREQWGIENNRPYAQFPVEEELSYVRAFYEERDIRVLDIQLAYQNVDVTCTVCGCPEPFVFGLFTYPPDAARLALSGFRVLDPGDPTLITGPLFRQAVDRPIAPVSSSECAQIFSTGTFIDGLLGNKKESCYIQAAISARDGDICYAIPRTEARDTCFTEVAIARRSASECDRIVFMGAKDACLIAVAGITRNASLCGNVSSETSRAYCIAASTP